MNKIPIILSIVTISVAACSTSRKSAASADSKTETPAAPIISSPNRFLMVKSAEGLHAPGNDELTAINTRYKNVSLETLKDGHQIYTEGACTNCHDAKNIYELEISQWTGILDEMAQKAMISDEQKDAVNKYVLSIKATQPK
jgi:type IV pilus biogenesis protein CpaD/CtpE